MRLSTIILPIYSWRDGRAVWRRAEQLGFHGAYTYDHLSWRTFRDGPWFGTMPTLTAAATATETIRLGTMVTNPNFRHPLTLAKDLMTLDDISGGRITLGIGAGGSGFDATVLGNARWSPRERADRFGEFLPLLSTLLQQDVTTSHGSHYTVVEARNIPGCVQKPRIPFYVAATGPRGLRLATQYGQGWATDLDATSIGDISVDDGLRIVKARLEKLTAACDAAGRCDRPRQGPRPRLIAQVPADFRRRLRRLGRSAHGVGPYRIGIALARPGLRIRRRCSGVRKDRDRGVAPVAQVAVTWFMGNETPCARGCSVKLGRCWSIAASSPKRVRTGFAAADVFVSLPNAPISARTNRCSR